MPYSNPALDTFLSDTVVPIYQSDPSVVTPADDAFYNSLAPDGSLNPFLIPDAFAYFVSLKYLPYRAFPMQLRLLDQYRKEALQGLWVPRWYNIPLDPGVAIAGGDTLNYEVHTAKKGSVLWGASFGIISPGTPQDIKIKLTDVCSGQPLMPQPQFASIYTPNFASGSPKAGFTCTLMMTPQVIGGDGDLLVDMINVNASARTCQLLLMCLEPR